MADLHVTKDRIDIIDDYTGKNKSIMLDKNTKAVVVSFGADETPVEMASNTSVSSLVEQAVTEQLPALLETALTDYAKKTDVGDGVVSIYQGDSLAGSFNVNQRTDANISLAAGGGGSDKIYHVNAELHVDGTAWVANSSTSSSYGYYNDCVVSVSRLPSFFTNTAIVELFMHMMYEDIPYGYEEGIAKELCPYGKIIEAINKTDTTKLTIRIYSKRSGWGVSSLMTRISFFVE